MTPRVYLASPLGFTEAGRHWAATVYVPAVRAAGFEPADPWAPSGAVDAMLAADRTPGPDRIRRLAAANDAVAAANVALIDGSHGMLAILDGTDVDSGTAAEVGYASARGIPIVGLRTDVRTSGDNDGSIVNLQVEHFITRTGGGVHTSLDAALADLRALVRG
jgi:nucleoside 2-deoxyribosyltransferase